MECHIIIFLIEVSDLTIFGYDLSDTQIGLRCWRNWINIFGYHPLLVTRHHPKGPLVSLLRQDYNPPKLWYELVGPWISSLFIHKSHRALRHFVEKYFFTVFFCMQMSNFHFVSAKYKMAPPKALVEVEPPM